jgi:homoserine kinase
MNKNDTDSIIVQVPATTANIGPGFDCLGAALTLYNQFKFTLSDIETSITVTGKEADKVSTDKTNLLYQSFWRLYQHLDKTPPPVAIEIDLGVPLARGLGSSATAIIGGLIGANELAGKPLTSEQLRELAIAIEGHPDNVVPALDGNCALSVATENGWQITQINWHSQVTPVVAIPDFELSTEAARAVLPSQVSYSDAIFNISHLGLLIRGLETGNPDWLTSALEDRLHQPYRKNLIQGYEAVKEAALAAGAYGMVISGAGPTLLALVEQSQAEAVGQAMEQAWENQGVKVEVRSLSLDLKGAKVN